MRDLREAITSYFPHLMRHHSNSLPVAYQSISGNLIRAAELNVLGLLIEYFPQGVKERVCPIKAFERLN